MKCRLFILLLFLLYGCSTSPTINTGLEGKVMPSFSLLLMDSVRQLTTSKIPTGQPTVFLLFAPNCPHCRAQTQEIINNIQSLSDIKFIIISTFPFNQIKEYYGHYQLGRYSNIITAQDYRGDFQNYFNVNAVPYMAVYNKQKMLKRVFLGKVKTSMIKNAAR